MTKNRLLLNELYGRDMFLPKSEAKFRRKMSPERAVELAREARYERNVCENCRTPKAANGTCFC